MRVCDVDSFYSPRAGGVKTYHDRKLEYFRGRPEHDYTLIYAAEESGIEELDGHTRIIRVRGPKMDSNYHFVLNAVSLHRALDLVRPDVIEIGEPYLLPWVVRLACARSKTPIVGYWHADFPVTYVRHPTERVSPRLAPVCERVAWWYARRTYGRLSAVMTAARGVQDQLDRHGLIATYHAPLGVDTVLFNPNRRSPELRASIGAPPHGAPADGPVIFFPHRLTEEKGLQIALEAFDWISQHVPAHLVVAGTGPGEPLLRSHMQRNERIHYLGYVADRPLLADWYASSDLVFALSPFETFGLAALEGMASGCPLVAAHGGALPELVQGAACGIVVQRERTDLVAQAALSLLCDSELHRWASTNARAYAESHHDWDGTFDTIVRCYADLLS